MLHVETWYHFGALIHEFHLNAYFSIKSSTLHFAQLPRPKDIVYLPQRRFFLSILGCINHIGQHLEEELTNFGYSLEEKYKI
jgi:hypothetical protein